MSDFVDVAYGRVRICKMFDTCNKCFLNKLKICGKLRDKTTKQDFEKLESAVREWLKDNPEPEYPRWVDVLADYGVVEKMGESSFYSKSTLWQPIPEDVAEKLGVKPK